MKHTHFFDSILHPGAFMNCYGVCFLAPVALDWAPGFADQPFAPPETRDSMHAEARAAGYTSRRIQDGLIWSKPQHRPTPALECHVDAWQPAPRPSPVTTPAGLPADPFKGWHTIDV